MCYYIRPPKIRPMTRPPANVVNNAVTLGVTGSIACYKAAYLCRLLREDGIKVRALMTPAAEEFVGAATFQALTGAAVIRGDAAQSGDGMDHIAAAREASLMVVAPASADFIAKAAAGFADNAVLATFLATASPKMLAPAMNRQMWLAPPTQRNIRSLIKDGVQILGPAAGQQACGDIGEGRMLEPEDIRAAITLALRAPMRGLRVVVSTGATAEAIDTMRVITNRSSGRMGFSIAAACREAGAEVKVVAAHTTAPPPPTLPADTIIRATTNDAMRETLMSECAASDMFISAAAIADFRPAAPGKTKAKRQNSNKNKDITLTLTPTADILAEVGQRFPRLFTIGFAALDGENPASWRAAAKRKMRAKNTNIIIANSVADADNDTSHLAIFTAGGDEYELPRQPKQNAAREVAALLAAQYNVSRETSAGVVV